MAYTFLRLFHSGMLLICVTACFVGMGCQSTSPMLEYITDGQQTFMAVQTTGKPVPAEELKSAVAIASLRCFQAGVVLGWMGGNGVAMKRLPSGWSPPVAIGVVKGDFGPLIGAQHVDIVMVFNDPATFDKFMESGSYFYAGAQGTAAATTGTTQASGPTVKTYISAGGIYAGASIGGMGILIKDAVNTKTYGDGATTTDILNGKYQMPPGGMEFASKLEGKS
ncbi:MAG: lipid-binding SYLF domain-containing protein [Planctomycetota bacterium]